MKIYYPWEVRDKVRTLCIRNGLFTCGTNRQYDRMFDMLEQPKYSAWDIAVVIWTCSDEADLNDIIAELRTIEYLDHKRYENETGIHVDFGGGQMDITLDREDVCKLMMACTITEQVSRPAYKFIWQELHEKIKEQLKDQDDLALRTKELFDELEKDGNKNLFVTGL